MKKRGKVLRGKSEGPHFPSSPPSGHHPALQQHLHPLLQQNLRAVCLDGCEVQWQCVDACQRYHLSCTKMIHHTS